MLVIIFICIIITVMIIFLLAEFHSHQKNLHSIPIRIHINGTRGKSSVTRLIGAGLRAGGIPTITKVTGTQPRLILENGEEVPILRKGPPNIIEQKKVVGLAAERNTQALVVECMALDPHYQWITEHRMIRSTVGVITNVRPDHLDIMGPTLNDVAKSLSATIPIGKPLFTSEHLQATIVSQNADKMGAVFHQIEGNEVSDEEMKRFSYIEHCENVALALAVCTHLGIDRNTALSGMINSPPDEGALTFHLIKRGNKQVMFYNAFAANDPQSTRMIWQKITRQWGFTKLRLILLNSRRDRLQRARDLVAMISRHLSSDFDYLLLIGDSTRLIAKIARKNDIPSDTIIQVGRRKPDEIFDKILSLVDDSATIVGMGNMGGGGADVVDLFQRASKEVQ